MAANEEKTLMSLGWKILPWMADLICALLVWWAYEINGELRDLRDEQRGIKADVASIREWRAETAGNRYTSKDHVAFAEQNAKEFQLVRADMSELKQQWLKEVGEIRVALVRLEAKMEAKP